MTPPPTWHGGKPALLKPWSVKQYFLLFRVPQCFEVVPFRRDLMRKMNNKPSKKSGDFLRINDNILLPSEFSLFFYKINNPSHNILNCDP